LYWNILNQYHCYNYK